MDDCRIEAVIFDLGNVLIDFDFLPAAKKVSDFTGKTAQEIYNLFFDSQLTALFEEGKIAPLDFFSGIKKLLGLELDYAQFLPIWNEIFFLSQKNLQVYSLAKILQARYKVALLTNVNVLHFEYLKKYFPIFDAFDSIITSFEAGARKPSPLIYNMALDSLGVKPQNTFYTDDRAELIESACGLGINGVVFQGVERLRQDLLTRGVSIN